MSKEELYLEGLGDPLVVGEFFSIIRGQGMEWQLEGRQQLNHGCSDEVRRLPRHLGEEAQARLAFRQGDESLLMPFANHGIEFPIPQPGAALHDRGSVLNGDAVA